MYLNTIIPDMEKQNENISLFKNDEMQYTVLKDLHNSSGNMADSRKYAVFRMQKMEDNMNVLVTGVEPLGR